MCSARRYRGTLTRYRVGVMTHGRSGALDVGRSTDIAIVEDRDVSNLDRAAALHAAPAPRPAAPGRSSAAVSRGSDYAELSRRVRAAGLLDRRPAYYRARIALSNGLFAVGWTVFALHGRSWWQLMIAAFLAVTSAQVGFLGHDARASAGVPFRASQQLDGPAVREPSHARRSYSPYSQGDRS
jgi:hypothetical protein